MAQDPEILYKLMVLYMLDQVNFPLTNSQLSEFFLDKEYTTYFTLQRVINDLCETGFIEGRPVGTQTHYEITDDGSATLRFFSSEMSKDIMADISEYLRQNKFRMRSEVSLAADYYRPENGDFIVQLRIREGKADILSIDISVPDEEAAKDMMMNWKQKAQSIYSGIMQSLM